MPAPNALATVTEVKQLLGLTDSSMDERLDLLVGAVSSEFEGVCNSFLRSRSRTERQMGGRKRIFLRGRPVVSVTSITDAAGNTVPATDYWLEPDLGLLQHFGRFPVGATAQGQPSPWTIVYVQGRWASTGDVPLDLKRAVAAEVQAFIDRGASEAAGVESVKVGDLAVGYGSVSNSDVDADSPFVWGHLSPKTMGVLFEYRTGAI